MALSDLLLKSQVNMAIARDSRFSKLPINVRVDNGVVTLQGDLHDASAAQGLESLVRGVAGVTDVRDAFATGGAHSQGVTAEQLSQMLLHKLEAEYSELPDQTAMAQADYLRWALWTVYKFHIPETVQTDNVEQAELSAVEAALTKLESLLSIPKALLAMEMLRQADAINDSPLNLVPDSTTSTLSSSPQASLDEQPDVNSHINRVGV